MNVRPGIAGVVLTFDCDSSCWVVRVTVRRTINFASTYLKQFPLQIANNHAQRKSINKSKQAYLDDNRAMVGRPVEVVVVVDADVVVVVAAPS